MTSEVARVEDLIESFRDAHDCETIERLADALAEAGDRRAIGPLLYRLCDAQVQEDRDVEDAVCGALVRFGVMTQLGNLNFRLRESSQMESATIATVEQYKDWIPRKYLQASK